MGEKCGDSTLESGCVCRTPDPAPEGASHPWSSEGLEPGLPSITGLAVVRHLGDIRIPRGI